MEAAGFSNVSVTVTTLQGVTSQAFTVYSKLLFGDASSVPSCLTLMDILLSMSVDDCGRKPGMNGVK